MVHFATRMYIHPDRWLPKDYRTAGKSREEKQINDALDELRVLIRRRYDQMLRGEETITAAMLKNAITGLDQSASTLLGVCDRFIEDYTDLLRTKQCCRVMRATMGAVPSSRALPFWSTKMMANVLLRVADASFFGRAATLFGRTFFVVFSMTIP